MFKVSKHSIERYIDRVLDIKINNKEELDDIITEYGGSIANTINNMILDSDLSIQVPVDMSTRNKSGLDETTEILYYLYRNIGIVVRNSNKKGNYVATLFIIPNDYMDDYEYIDHIVTITKKINRLQFAYNELMFKDKNSQQQKIKERIIQYQAILFENPIAKG